MAGYVVRVSAWKLLWPGACACCLGPPEATAKMATNRDHSQAPRGYVRWWEVPYCHRCLRHHDCVRELDEIEVEFKEAQGNEDGDRTLWLVTGIVVFPLAPLFFWLAWKSKKEANQRLRDLETDLDRAHQRLEKALSPNCARDGLAVRYEGWYGSVHTFRFTNRAYCERFMELNEKKLC